MTLFSLLAVSAHATVYDIDVDITLPDTAPTAFDESAGDWIAGQAWGPAVSHAAPPVAGIYKSDEMVTWDSTGEHRAFTCVVNDAGHIRAQWTGVFVQSWPTWPTDADCVITDGPDTWNITITVTESVGAPDGSVDVDPADIECQYHFRVFEDDGL